MNTLRLTLLVILSIVSVAYGQTGGPYILDWSTIDGGGGTSSGGQHDVGMVAEEVGEVLPEIVEYEEYGIDATGMDDSKLTPLLVEAVKALKAENDALKKIIEALKQKCSRYLSCHLKNKYVTV